MAVAYESIGSAGAVTGTSDTDIVCGIPSGTTSGSMLVAIIASAASKYPSASGWTRISTDSAYLGVLYRIADGTEGSSVTFNLALSYSYAHGVILRFSGHDSATSPSVSTEEYYDTWDTTLNIPSSSVSISGSGLILAGAVLITSYTGSISSCSRSGAVERYESDIDGNSCNPLILTEDNVSSGPISASTITLTSAKNAKHGQIVVIPASSGSTVKPTYYYAQQ